MTNLTTIAALPSTGGAGMALKAERLEKNQTGIRVYTDVILPRTVTGRNRKITRPKTPAHLQVKESTYSATGTPTPYTYITCNFLGDEAPTVRHVYHGPQFEALNRKEPAVEHWYDNPEFVEALSESWPFWAVL